jgi:pimeloyl-ACP methyl ester carboxylesterase
MADLAADAASVLDHLGVTEAFVVGLSMGGMIAQELALREPRRVRALVLGCTHCGGEQRIPPAPQVLAAFVDNVGLAQEQIIEKNLPFFFSAGFFSASPADVDSYRQAQLEAPLQPPHALAAQLAAIRSFESCSRLAAVRPPTLIVTGTQDVLVPRENARLLAQLIPHAEYHEIPGAGHAIHVECREELNRLIHTFLQRCGGTTPTEIRRS